MQYTPSTEARRSGFRGPAATWALIFTTLLMGGMFLPEPPQAAAARTAGPRVQQVVQQQLAALAQHDAKGAFALADPDMRTQFVNAEAFLATVRDEYPMLMKASNVLFLRPKTDGTIAVQKVRISDDSGSAWSLTYLLNRQQDDQWRISGCVVTPEGPRILT